MSNRMVLHQISIFLNSCCLGNHAQGVAISAKKLGIKAKIVMPVPTPAIKVSQLKN